MADKACTGDCLKCSMPQQIYCAAQHGHAVLGAVPVIVARLDRLEAALNKFGQPSEIINPLQDAQIGAGAENRVPESINNL